MLSKLYDILYNKIYIVIVTKHSKSVVYVEECNHKRGVIKSYEESFDTLDISEEMYSFIKSAMAQSPFYYISVLDYSDSQGAIPTCSTKEMSLFYDVESSKQICYKHTWAYYTSKINLNTLQKHYSKIGVDFVFSPFVVLANFFKDKIDTNFALFILIEDEFITMSIFNESKLLYASHVSIGYSVKSDSESFLDDSHEEEIDLDDSIDLDDINAIDDLDSFGDIEDLDSIDEIDEFAEIDEDDTPDIEESNENELMKNDESFTQDYTRFLQIQNAINDFYKDDKYKSEFIENIYVGDTIGVSVDLKRYLEEEMFLSVYIRQIDLCAEVCEIAKAELK